MGLKVEGSSPSIYPIKSVISYDINYLNPSKLLVIWVRSLLKILNYGWVDVNFFFNKSTFLLSLPNLVPNIFSRKRLTSLRFSSNKRFKSLYNVKLNSPQTSKKNHNLILHKLDNNPLVKLFTIFLYSNTFSSSKIFSYHPT